MRNIRKSTKLAGGLLGSVLLLAACGGGSDSASDTTAAGGGSGSGDTAMTITYDIADAAVWEDGTPITVADFQCTLDAVMNTPGSISTSGYDKITSVAAGDSARWMHDDGVAGAFALGIEVALHPQRPAMLPVCQHRTLAAARIGHREDKRLSVVDDADMGITHVIRGEDHLSNTPKHILLFQALGVPLPRFAHLPLILNPDRTKMSKRKSQTALADYRAEGFLQEALINFLALLGWSTGSEDEILSVEELQSRFDLEHVQKGGAVFDRVRLEWINGQWIRRLDNEELLQRLRPFYDAAAADGRIARAATDEELAKLLPIIRERIQLLAAAIPLTDFLFAATIAHDPALLVPKRWDAATTIAALEAARPILADGIGEDNLGVRLFTEAGYTVATGGYEGIMGAASRGARSKGGDVLGYTVTSWDGLPANEAVTVSPEPT